MLGKCCCDNELVSVVMPAYNVEEFIGVAIRSVLKQTYRNWELIIIDDGSRDRTVEVVSAFNDKRIKLVKHEANKGLAAARNRGIAEAVGKWIAWLDADDAWNETTLTKLVDVARSNPDSFIGCDVMACNSESYSRLSPLKKGLKDHVLPPVFSVKQDDLFKYPLDLRPMCSRDVIVNNNIYFVENYSGHEWLYFVLQLYAAGLTLFVVSEPLYYYRIRPGSDSSSYASVVSQLKTLYYLISAEWIASSSREFLRDCIIPTRHRLITTAIREKKWAKAFMHILSDPMGIIYAIGRILNLIAKRVG